MELNFRVDCKLGVEVSNFFTINAIKPAVAQGILVRCFSECFRYGCGCWLKKFQMMSFS